MGEPISDNPSFKKLSKDILDLKELPKLSPHVNLPRNFQQEVSEIEQQLEEFRYLPDRFNNLFVEQGWTMYELMDIDLARTVVELAENGEMEQAERKLVDHYSVENVRKNLTLMNAIVAFRPRMALAEKALRDYEAERYYACVLVVLTLMDGMTKELNPQNLGMFAKEANIEASNSISAHNQGLGRLIRVLTKNRQGTTQEPISIPYRNGILHGMDLNYDNKIVAAKCWAALFAVRDWAIKAERDLLVALPELEKADVKSSRSRFLESAWLAKQARNWKPRTVIVGYNIPGTGEPDVFEDGTPEQKLSQFIKFWRDKNFGKMAQCVLAERNLSNRQIAGDLRAYFDKKALISFAFNKVEDLSSPMTRIKTHLVYQEQGSEISCDVMFVLHYRDASGEALLRQETNGQWLIYNWGVLGRDFD